MDQPTTKSRSALIGAIGFSLGGTLGNIATYLIAISGIVGWLLRFIDEGQPLVRLLFAIVLAFLTIAAGAAVTGVVNGLALHRIDTQASRRNLLAGSGYAFAVGQGIIVIPMLLVISLIALYNNGPKVQPQAFVLLFGLFGLVYGLIIGLILSLLTVRLRRVWSVLLAAIIGYVIGGVLVGLLVWRAEYLSSGFVPLRAALRLLVLSLAVNIPSGAALGLAYHWIAGQRAIAGDKSVKPALWQQIIVIAASLVIFVYVVAAIRHVESFLTFNPAAPATQLSSETIGVHWSSPTNITSETLEVNPSAPDVFASENDHIAVVWSQEVDNDSDIFFASQEEIEGGQTTWSEPVNVSNNPSLRSTRPQVILDSDGEAHIVWEEFDPASSTSQILYRRCKGTDCSEAIQLSAPSDLTCAAQVSGDDNHWPAVAIDEAGRVMAVWSPGGGSLVYSTWLLDESPPAKPAGCVLTPGDLSTSHPQPSLAGGPAGMFAVAYSTGEPDLSGDIFMQRYRDGVWENPASVIGHGFVPQVIFDREGQTHIAWCSQEGSTSYQYNGGSTETISFPGCLGRVELGQDSQGIPHLVWFSDEVENVNGITLPANLIYESIRADNGWSPPAIVIQTDPIPQPSLASGAGGALHLAWRGAQAQSGAINYVRQDPYQCDVNSLTELGKVALETMQSGGFHPQGYQVPYCQNRFIDFIYQPNPQPAFSSDSPEFNGGFDRVAELVQNVQYEVLFVNMEWDEDENNLSPGSSFARGVADLYQRIKADPSQYPRGLLVRILLGNYPEISTLEWGTQIWNVMDDLRDAGVDELENPDIGWKVEVADYAGTYPHSHTKFIVIDGKLLLGAGFNYGWLHLPKDHPSGKGDDLVDLGTVILGPVAQAAISAYDDLWVGANMLHCTDFHPANGTSWTDTCQWSKATVSHLPEVLKYYPADSQHNAFSLFRTTEYKEADETYAAVLRSAQSTIDAVHVNFSLELICMANLLVEDLCTYDNALPWMRAMMDAIEQNQIKVRVIVENANSNGLENRVAIQAFTDELKKRDLEDLVEIRFFNGRVHAKTALIDQELLIVGSQNFHYSSWGEGGLNEYNVATDAPEAIALYQDMFDYFWEQAIPVDEADWATAK